MTVVIDASVAIKWFVPNNEAEEDADKAIKIFKAIQKTSLSPVQPVHWQAEVIAVLSRFQSKALKQCIQFLDILEFPVSNTLEVYQLASELSITHNHHLFDTLYHSVAIQQKATLITADIKYYRKVKKLGNIVLLSNFQI